ncbi:xylose isomerase [Thermus scotoductus]|uniref:Xylose isomerase n=1 Tax=Thermus scotoductus TaxID=37636 RepID=A0A430QWC3_THESC|nr:TIM barrel protein [Thermus scotoductus]RTG99375.1 xylose isomerase [Thermus scotoductus]
MSGQPPLRFGNAPCSWGTIEGFGQGIPYDRMLDELKETGYEGSELGDFGYMPTDPERLREAFLERGLVLLGGFVGVPLTEKEEHGPGEAHAVRTAALMAALADLDPGWKPLLVLADAHSRDPVRFQRAGRIRPEEGLEEEGWQTLALGIRRIAQAVGAAAGLETVFHFHAASYVETPEEIDRLVELTGIPLVFDTGHYLYGSGALEGEVVLEGLRRLMPFVRYVHFKDLDPRVAERARREGWDYKKAVGQGLFCELGRGAIDFGRVARFLVDQGYRGFVTVEQDVLPGMGTPKESALRSRIYLRQVTGW